VGQIVNLRPIVNRPPRLRETGQANCQSAAEAGPGNPVHNHVKNIFAARISLEQHTLTKATPLSPGLARSVLTPARDNFQSGAVLRRPFPGSNFLARKRRIEVKLDFRSC
jgi:hypothetical protein